MFTPQQLDFLQALTRGERSRAQWLGWLREHGDELQSQLERRDWLRLKLRPYETACEITAHANRTSGNGLAFCEICGGEILNAVPGVTTQAHIRAWVARYDRANLVDTKLIEGEIWIHPGRYCPQSCADKRISYVDRDGNRL